MSILSHFLWFQAFLTEYPTLNRVLHKVIPHFSCFQTTESDHFVTFRGPLDGSPDCPINQLVEFDGTSLFDVYQAVIGYDDLYDFIGDRQVTYRKGAHYKFECKGN